MIIQFVEQFSSDYNFFLLYYSDYNPRWSKIHSDDIETDTDWIRKRDERLEREIREQEHFVDREIRDQELRESEQHYEVTAKHSRIRAQLSYENPYDPPEEGEELRYVVTDEDQQHSQRQPVSPQ